MKQVFILLLLLSMLPLSTLASDEHSSSHNLSNASLSNTWQKVSYVCPMHTHIVRDHQGTCPICGMDLVARENKPEQTLDVNVSGEMQQAMALTTEVVDKSQLWRFIKTYGAVEYNETSLTHLHSKSSGWIEKLYVNSVGQPVKKGELLYEIYSKELLVAQEEFLTLLDARGDHKELLRRGKQRLRLLGFDEKLIEQLVQSKKVFYVVPYYAQQDGFVSVLNVREGMYVEPQNEIMTLADLSKVWVIANIFESQINWVSEGKSLELDLPALDLYNIEGVVEFIYPTLDPVTRTLQVRLSLQNPEQRLKPGMLAKVRIYAGAIESINIPVNALIQTEKSNHVFVQLENGRFERRAVDIGLITNQRVEIRHGLEIDEKVVTSGQFLLDAEASLSNTATLSPSAAHQH